MEGYFRSQPDPERGYGLAALTGGLDFAGGQAGADPRPRRRPCRSGAVRAVLRLRRRPGRNRVADLARRPARRRRHAGAIPDDRGRDPRRRGAQGRAGSGRRLARRPRRQRPLCPAQADHRWPARRRLGATGENGAGGVRQLFRLPRLKSSGTGCGRRISTSSLGWRDVDRNRTCAQPSASDR